MSMRFSVICSLIVVLFPALLTSGELKVSILSVPQTCVGDTLHTNVRVENINASFPINSVLTTLFVRRGATVVCSKVLPLFNLATSEKKDIDVNFGWPPDVEGSYNVEIRANGSDNINGLQTASQNFLVCSSAPCPDRPTASGTIIYLGTTSSGSISYSTPKPECCYEIKFTIVTGRNAVTSHTPQNWTTVGSPTTVSVSIDRSKWNGTYVVGRVDWRTCDKSKSGSDYILVRDGTAPLASGPTTPPPPHTGVQTANSGTDADPVITSTGEFTTPMHVDVITKSDLDIVMQRDYQSLLSVTNAKDGDFGPGWTHPFDYTLVRGDNEVYIQGPKGLTVRFRKPSDSWILDWPTDKAYGFSTPNDSTWAFYDPDRNIIVAFNKDGHIRFIDNTYGYRNIVNYEGPWIGSIHTPSERGLTFTRDTSGRITSITNGVSTVRYGYTNGILTSFTDGMGNVTTYNYQPSTHYLISWTTPEGRTPLINTYNATGGVTQQDLGDGFIINFSRVGAVTTITYPMGITRTHTHNTSQQLTQATSATGGTSTFTYNANGNRTSVKDMVGGTQTRTFLNGRRIGFTNADGSGINTTYSERDINNIPIDMIERVDVINGPSTLYGHDAVRGVINLITKSTGEETSFTYPSNEYRPSAVKTFFGSTSMQYTTDGLLSQRTAPDGAVYTYTYDPAGFPIDIKKNGSAYASFTFNLNGLMTQWTQNGTTTKATYDKDRLLTSLTDAENRTWTNIYDNRGRLVVVRNPTDTGVHYTWIGPILRSMQFGDGQKYTLTPNADGYPNLLVNGAGDTWNLGVNKEGSPAKLTYPDGSVWNYGTDPMGRASSITSPLGFVTGYEYGPTGMLERLRLPNGNEIRTVWNADQTEASTTLNGTVSLNMTREFTSQQLFTKSITDADNYTWNQEINGSTRINTLTSPNGRSSKVTYDANWKPLKLEFGAGATINYQYNNSTTTLSDGTESRTITTNKAGETTMMNGEEVVRDAAGRVTSTSGVTATRSTGGRVSAYSWDNKVQASYDYDLRGYLTGITDRLGGKTSISYNSNGKITKIDMPGGFSLSYDWNPDGLISKVSSNDSWNMSYEYNSKGQIATIIRTDDVPLLDLGGNADIDVSYDAGNRLANGTYDGWGNIVRASFLGIELTYGGFGARTFKDGASTRDYTTDAYGSPRSIGSGMTVDHRFRFNHIGNDPTIVQYTGSTGTSDYISTPTGRPLYTINDMGVYHYLIDDGRGNVVAERDQNGTYTGARVITPYGVTVGKSGLPGVLGYRGMGSMISLNSDAMMIGNGRIYDPVLGRMRDRIGILDGYPARFDPYGAYPECWEDDPWYDEYYDAECTVTPIDLRPRLVTRVNLLSDEPDFGVVESARLRYQVASPSAEYSIGSQLKVDLTFPHVDGLDYEYKIMGREDERNKGLYYQTLPGIMELLFPPRDIEREPRVDVTPKTETPRKK